MYIAFGFFWLSLFFVVVGWNNCPKREDVDCNRQIICSCWFWCRSWTSFVLPRWQQHKRRQFFWQSSCRYIRGDGHGIVVVRCWLGVPLPVAAVDGDFFLFLHDGGIRKKKKKWIFQTYAKMKRKLVWWEEDVTGNSHKRMMSLFLNDSRSPCHRHVCLFTAVDGDDWFCFSCFGESEKIALIYPSPLLSLSIINHMVGILELFYFPYSKILHMSFDNVVCILFASWPWSRGKIN